MAVWNTTKDFLRTVKRDFTHKRGRMGRSRFFVNLCLLFGLSLLYLLLVFIVVQAMDAAGVPRVIHNSVYYLCAGAMHILVAIYTRGLRYKRLRDMGLPTWCDLPFMLAFLSIGFGAFFYFFDVPYLRNLDVVHMPASLRDPMGVIWIIWSLVMILAPSKHRGNIFTCSLGTEQAK